MRLRSRMVGDAEDDGSAVASASSSSMDENSSTEAVLGSPVTRRSWSTHGSQNPPPSPTPVTSSTVHLNQHDPQAYQYDPQPSRGEQNTYLTDYETTAQTEQSDYPTEISDSQDLYAPSQAQTHSPEDPNIYVQPTSPLPPQPQPYIYSNPQTPTQHEPQHAGFHNMYMTPASQTPIHDQFAGYNAQNSYAGYDRSFTTPHSQTPTRAQLQPQYSDYHSYMTAYTQPPSRAAEYQNSTLAPLYIQFSSLQPTQPSQPSEYYQQNTYTQLPHPQIPASETLNRFVAPDADQSWSPVLQPNPQSHKRRISEVDSTVGYRDKLRTELDEMEGGDEGGAVQVKKKRRRWTRGKTRGRGGSGGRGNGKGRDKRGGRGNGGGREMRV